MNRPVVVAALVGTMFMAAIEATVVATAMPTIVRDLGGLELYAWVFSIYMVCSTVTVPIYGKLADIYGRKPLLTAGILLFLAGSAGAGAATSMPMLIAFRALQGLGAGAMQPLTLTIVGDLFRIDERAKIQAAFGAMWGLAGTAGPLAGSLIIQYFSWRWVFYVNLPLALIALVAFHASYRETVARRDRPLDWAGALLLTATVLAVLNAESSVTHALILLPAAAVGLWLFVRVQRRASDPILPLSLMSSRFMLAASAFSAVVGATMLPVVSFLPLFVQGLREGSPLDAGFAIMPMMVSWPLMAFISGRMLPRIGARPAIRVGSLAIAGSTILLAWGVATDKPIQVIQLANLLLGAGLGMASSSLMVAVQESVGWARRGVATASQLFFRTMAGSVVVGALGAIIAMHLAGVAGLHGDLAADLLGPEHGRNLGAEIFRSAHDALAAGLATSFWIVAGFGVFGAIVGMTFPLALPEDAQRERPTGP